MIIQLQELAERLNQLKFEDFAEVDAIKRKAELLIKNIFTSSSDYFDDLDEIDFPRCDKFAYAVLGEDRLKEEWELSRKKMLNLVNIAVEDAKIKERPRSSRTKRKKLCGGGLKSNRIFIVHGKDDAMKESVARTVEKLGLEPIILHEKPNEGRTVIEKFTDYSDVQFSIVLLSPDDFGCPREEGINKGKFRARQNVILELGFFLGKLGRKNVMPIYKESDNFDMPSDYKGVVYTPFDSNDQWKFKLVKELRACNYKVDANKII